MKIETWAIERVTPYARNPRKNEEAVAVVAASLQEFGWQQPLVVDADGVLLVGHTRLKAAQRLGWAEVPVQVARDLTPQQAKAYRIMDNRSGERAEWDMDLLALELEDLRLDDFDLDLTGFEAGALEELLDAAAGEGEDEPPADRKPPGSLSDRFGIPPFSVLNAREGWWQDRKRAWLALGIRSEVGRGENLLQMSDTMLEPDPAKRAAMKGKARTFGQDLMRGEHVVGGQNGGPASGDGKGRPIADSGT